MNPQKSNLGSIFATIIFITIIIASASYIWKNETVQNWVNDRLSGKTEENSDLPTPTPTPSKNGFDFGTDQEASESSSSNKSHMIIRTSGDYIPTEVQLEAAKNSIK